MISTETYFWDDLLPLIEDGQVVPIVGRDLLEMAPQQFFHRMVAEQLAAELKIPSDRLPPNFETNDVVCAFADFHGDSLAVRPQLILRILSKLKPPDPSALPEALRLLAEIPEFHLFISTTFDTLLEEAIESVRKRKPAVVSFPPSSSNIDFDEALLDQSGSMVFQVLGRASVSSTFAMTEGQMLEQMHDFMAGEGRPKKLIAKLQQSHLLILGVDFPDWLARFLLRLTRSKPLWDSRNFMEFIADARCMQPGFAQFLERFSPLRSHLYTDGTPTDFVRELHRRRFERHPATEAPVVNTTIDPEKPSVMAPGSIFVSYASEDRKAAFQLADELSQAGLEVWIDRRLRPGDNFRDVIESNIRLCSAFVGVVSRNTQDDSGEGRWFRKEREQAVGRAGFWYGTDRRFLFPVVVDNTPNSELMEYRKQTFGERSAARAVDGRVPPELIQELDAAQKAYRRNPPVA
ncbi:MAG: toll/interleukin-1 receptor domain-containing protein [Candidatus Acidiferrales bacterium]